MKLTKQDRELIELASQVALGNNDLYEEEVTVGCVLKAKSGKLYKGINIYNSHAVCAEQVAIGQALACGERNFDTIVAVKLEGNG